MMSRFPLTPTFQLTKSETNEEIARYTHDHCLTGEGLFAVTDTAEAAAALDAIRSDYVRHSDAAREIAAEHFRAETVLGRMLDEL